MNWFHKWVHKMNWHRGQVVSWTDDYQRIKIGFQCSKCGLITGILDATGIVDRDVAQALGILGKRG